MILENAVSQHGVLFLNKSHFSRFTKERTDYQERLHGWDRLGKGHGILTGILIIISVTGSETSWKNEIHNSTQISHAQLLEPSFKPKIQQID